ncbi:MULTISPECIES: hypothetical protein [Cryobacterium]|uniref:Tfp pilus assembly protein PilN n=1 Tax=Cryobacterium levicorallinum TaxID=995038 RepID=A0A1I3EDV8_9MICO|nr:MULTISPECIES: hypothetical protein [Cryobacterium]TFB83363.1 hypothetical protein E3O11_11020 [Cryobacterium levicorallinum]TFD58211.1 hypothetical protein E3T41_11710 [Cryobacterium sp. Hh38]GEP28706.1 hypothetical protein CLE01_33040 [Cryobacterium levicorallinum]SFH97170.1 hypothetical protein SAMN05216274_1253 [Cryobacterium levicorallinum]
MKHRSNRRELVYGGEPRANLLPLELKAKRKGKMLRRIILAASAGVVFFMAASIGAVSVQAGVAQADLAHAEARTNELLLESAKYSQVRSVQAQIDLTAAARTVGTKTEIDWRAYLAEVRVILPSVVTIDAVTIDSGSPWEDYAQSTVALHNPRVATLTLSLTSPSLPAVPQWLTNLKMLPGFADASLGSITRSESGTYVVDIEININADARANRVGGGN